MPSSASAAAARPAPLPRLENPFNVKVFQVFTGFGVGCGVGVGVGRPIHLGAIPMLQQVMSAARGATDAFSGIGRYANTSLRKLGLNNIEVGVGCGVGIGHGFGVGIALKPRVLLGIQSSILELVSKTMSNLEERPGFSAASKLISGSLPTNAGSSSSNLQISNGTTAGLEAKTVAVADGMQHQRSGEIMSLQEQKQEIPDQKERTTSASQAEKILNKLSKNIISQDGMERFKKGDNLEATNNMIQMLLQHHQVIEELREENERLRQILMEDLNVPPSKLLQVNHHKRGGISWQSNNYSCSSCFECRRRHRKVGISY